MFWNLRQKTATRVKDDIISVWELLTKEIGVDQVEDINPDLSIKERSAQKEL